MSDGINDRYLKNLRKVIDRGWKPSGFGLQDEGRLKWSGPPGTEPTETIPYEALKKRLTELRKKSRYSLSVLSPYELDEIDYIEKELRKAGITYIGEPPPLRLRKLG